jgi:hypothetical protein
MNDTITTNPVYEKPLKKGHALAIINENDCEVVQVRNAKGIALFSISISDEATTLTIAAENIELKASNKIAISADVVQIGSVSEISMKSEGDLLQTVEGDVTMITKGDKQDSARIQNLTADLGNINIKANDDVKLVGERIKLN